MQPRWRKRSLPLLIVQPTSPKPASCRPRGKSGSPLQILFGIERPEPVLVVAVRLLDARSGAPIALVAGRAAELVGIVNLQQRRVRMADEGLGVVVRRLGALALMKRRSLHGFARAHVAGFAAVDDICFGDVDLLDRGSRSSVFFSSPAICAGVRSTMWSLTYSSSAAFAWVTGFSVSPSSAFSLARWSLRLLYVSSSCESVWLLAAIGIFDGGLLGLVLVQILLNALLGRRIGFDLISESVDVGAAVGKHALYCQDFCAQIADLLLQIANVRGSCLRGLIEVLLSFW